jgi:hypothetical protein
MVPSVRTVGVLVDVHFQIELQYEPDDAWSLLSRKVLQISGFNSPLIGLSEAYQGH